jgi:hypothetical protein
MNYELSKFKKDYEVLVGKYDLPSFDGLNERFEIGKIDKESGILLKDVRKIMMESVFNFLNFLEMLMNPVNAPRMYHVAIKKMGDGEREKIEKIYSGFSTLIVRSMKAEIDYSEDGEAKLIRDVFNKWEELKGDFKFILDFIENPGDSKKKKRDYLG